MNFLNNLVPPEKHPMHSWDHRVYSSLEFGPQTPGSLGLGLWGRIGVLPEFSSLTYKKSGGDFLLV